MNGEGWFVLNMRDAEWRHANGRGAVCVILDDFEGERRAVGSGPCLVIAVGARAHDGQPNSLGFTVDDVAKRHRASVEVDTMDGGAAYAAVPQRRPTPYRDGWLPD